MLVPTLLGSGLSDDSTQGAMWAFVLYVADHEGSALPQGVSKTPCRAVSPSITIESSGAGSVGYGCVGDVQSPGTCVCGPGPSSMGQIGSPVSRLSQW